MAEAARIGIPIATPSTNGGGDMHLVQDREPDNKIVDATGKTIPTTKEAGFMVRADRQMSKPAGLSVGATIALSVCPMALTIILAIIGYLMLFTGDGATVKTKVEALNEKMEMYQKMNVAQAEATAKLLDEIKGDVKEMNRGYQDMREFKAKMEGVKAGVLAGSK